MTNYQHIKRVFKSSALEKKGKGRYKIKNDKETTRFIFSAFNYNKV